METKRVQDFMAKNYASLSPNTSIPAAVTTLLEYHQSSAPVIDATSQLVGLLSEADAMRASLTEGYHGENSTLVKDLMTENPDTVSPEMELSAVAELFLKNNRRMMPVIKAGTLVGILSREHILTALNS